MQKLFFRVFTLFCEHCVRAYLKNNFSNWKSGNNDIDDLIQKCQMKLLDTENGYHTIIYGY